MSGEAVSAPYWEGTRRRTLLIQWCPACDAGIHYPRAVCPRCGGQELSWRTSAGTGAVNAHAYHPVPGADGYVVALVDLDEGVRLLTRIVDCPPERVVVGMRVQLSWMELEDGRALPVFGPASAASLPPA